MASMVFSKYGGKVVVMIARNNSGVGLGKRLFGSPTQRGRSEGGGICGPGGCHPAKNPRRKGRGVRRLPPRAREEGSWVKLRMQEDGGVLQTWWRGRGDLSGQVYDGIRWDTIGRDK